MGSEMTYQEMLDIYRRELQTQTGTESMGAEGQVSRPLSWGEPVTLPDGTMLSPGDDGSMLRINSDGPTYTNEQEYSDGRAPTTWQSPDENKNWRGSALGALGMLAMPVAGAALASYGAGAGTGAAAAGAAGGELTAAQIAAGMTGGTAAAAVPAAVAAPTAAAVAPVAAAGAPAAATAPTLAQAAGATTAASTAAGLLSDGAAEDAANAAAGGNLFDAPSGFDMSNLPTDVVKWLRANPQALAAMAGSAAAVAGNSDISNTQTGTTTSAGTNTSSMTGNSTGTQSGNATTATQGQTQSSLAPWLDKYAQDYVARVDTLTRDTGTNADLALAQDQTRQRAVEGDPLVRSASNQQADLISGKYLNSNPYIDNVARSISDRMSEGYATGTRASLTAGAQRSGNDPRYSSAYGQTVGNADRAFGDSLGMTMSNLYANNYQNERNAQDSASRYAPQMSQFDVNATNSLTQSGQDQRQWPYQQLDYQRNSLNPSFGSTTQSNNTGATNTWGQNSTANTANTWGQNNSTGTNSSTSNITAPNNWTAAAGGGLTGAALYRMLFPQG